LNQFSLINKCAQNILIHKLVRLIEKFSHLHTITLNSQYNYARLFVLHISYVQDIFTSLGYESSAPRNLSYSHKIQKGINNVLLVNLTWDIPELTHGSIRNYMVEYESIDASAPTSYDLIMVCMYVILIFNKLKCTLVRL